MYYSIYKRKQQLRICKIVSPDVSLDRVDASVHDPDQDLVWGENVDEARLLQLQHLGSPKLVHPDGLHLVLIQMQRIKCGVHACLFNLLGLCKELHNMFENA